MIKNKKAQVLDTILSNVIVFITLVIVVAVFTTIAFGNILIKSPNNIQPSHFKSGENLLFKTAIFENKEALIIDHLSKELEKIEPDTGYFNSALEPLINSQNNCAIIVKGSNLIGGYILYNGQKQPLASYSASIISNPGQIRLTKVKSNEMIHEITSYFGKCT